MKKSVFLFNIIVILLALFVNVYSEDIFFYKAYISDSKIIYNENEIEFESPVVTIDNQTYIPLREAAEKMDISVEWNGEDHRIVLTKNSNDAAREIFNNLFEFALSPTAEILNYDYFTEDDEQYFIAKISFNQSDLEYFDNNLSISLNRIDMARSSSMISYYNNIYTWWDLSELNRSVSVYRRMKSGVRKKTVDMSVFITPVVDDMYYLYLYYI